MRRTERLAAVAGALLADPHGRHYGYELCKQTRIRSGVVYPMLTRLLNAGWIADGWEDPTTIDGRPPRRYYTLTDEGREMLRGYVAVSGA